MVVALGHQFPNYTYGANVGVHDLRMYVGPALSDAQVIQTLRLPLMPQPNTDYWYWALNSASVSKA